MWTGSIRTAGEVDEQEQGLTEFRSEDWDLMHQATRETFFPDWLFAFVVFNILTAQKWVNKYGGHSESSLWSSFQGSLLVF